MSEPAKRGRGRPAKNTKTQAAEAPANTPEAPEVAVQPQAAPVAPQPVATPTPEPERSMTVVLLRKYVPTGYFVDGKWMKNVYDQEVGGMEQCPKGTVLNLKEAEAARAIRKGIATMPLPEFDDE